MELPLGPVAEVQQDVLEVVLMVLPLCYWMSFVEYPLNFHSFSSFVASHHSLDEWVALFGIALDQPMVSVEQVVVVEVLASNWESTLAVAGEVEQEQKQKNERMKKTELLTAFFLQQLEQA